MARQPAFIGDISLPIFMSISSKSSQLQFEVLLRPFVCGAGFAKAANPNLRQYVLGADETPHERRASARVLSWRRRHVRVPALAQTMARSRALPEETRLMLLKLAGRAEVNASLPPTLRRQH